ncbi:hypothetical protein BDN72DRAFT_965163 [Pluteus cervinus]|uniref:Uncharacterized protein n=1 Tax=Pluteus cervinus TaxID=181527 RepID=A0ACD3A6H4_9AGAR|nr:hypothetical protein BDN72DRAFT_965163 [Pluteus cervinus]
MDTTSNTAQPLPTPSVLTPDPAHLASTSMGYLSEDIVMNLPLLPDEPTLDMLSVSFMIVASLGGAAGAQLFEFWVVRLWGACLVHFHHFSGLAMAHGQESRPLIAVPTRLRALVYWAVHCALSHWAMLVLTRQSTFTSILVNIRTTLWAFRVWTFFFGFIALSGYIYGRFSIALIAFRDQSVIGEGTTVSQDDAINEGRQGTHSPSLPGGTRTEQSSRPYPWLEPVFKTVSPLSPPGGELPVSRHLPLRPRAHTEHTPSSISKRKTVPRPSPRPIGSFPSLVVADSATGTPRTVSCVDTEEATSSKSEKLSSHSSAPELPSLSKSWGWEDSVAQEDNELDPQEEDRSGHELMESDSLGSEYPSTPEVTGSNPADGELPAPGTQSSTFTLASSPVFLASSLPRVASASSSSDELVLELFSPKVRSLSRRGSPDNNETTLLDGTQPQTLWVEPIDTIASIAPPEPLMPTIIGAWTDEGGPSAISDMLELQKGDSETEPSCSIEGKEQELHLQQQSSLPALERVLSSQSESLSLLPLTPVSNFEDTGSVASLGTPVISIVEEETCKVWIPKLLYKASIVEACIDEDLASPTSAPAESPSFCLEEARVAVSEDPAPVTPQVIDTPVPQGDECSSEPPSEVYPDHAIRELQAQVLAETTGPLLALLTSAPSLTPKTSEKSLNVDQMKVPQRDSLRKRFLEATAANQGSKMTAKQSLLALFRPTSDEEKGPSNDGVTPPSSREGPSIDDLSIECPEPAPAGFDKPAATGQEEKDIVIRSPMIVLYSPISDSEELATEILQPANEIRKPVSTCKGSCSAERLAPGYGLNILPSTPLATSETKTRICQDTDEIVPPKPRRPVVRPANGPLATTQPQSTAQDSTTGTFPHQGRTGTRNSKQSEGVRPSAWPKPVSPPRETKASGVPQAGSASPIKEDVRPSALSGSRAQESGTKAQGSRFLPPKTPKKPLASFVTPPVAQVAVSCVSAERANADVGTAPQQLESSGSTCDIVGSPAYLRSQAWALAEPATTEGGLKSRASLTSLKSWAEKYNVQVKTKLRVIRSMEDLTEALADLDLSLKPDPIGFGRATTSPATVQQGTSKPPATTQARLARLESIEVPRTEPVAIPKAKRDRSDSTFSLNSAVPRVKYNAGRSGMDSDSDSDESERRWESDSSTSSLSYMTISGGSKESIGNGRDAGDESERGFLGYKHQHLSTKEACDWEASGP